MSSLKLSWIKTSSLNAPVTDSAAAATAYACGIKTYNGRLALDNEGKACETLVETAMSAGKGVYILTTDNNYGATPSAFYVHTRERYDYTEIDRTYSSLKSKIFFKFNSISLVADVKDLLEKLNYSTKEYFVVIEGAKIDKASHVNDFHKMKKEMIDFDKAVKMVFDFATSHDAVVYVTADHETGGIDDETCVYSTYHHTPVNVPLFFFNSGADIEKTYDNTDVYYMIYQDLFGVENRHAPVKN